MITLDGSYGEGGGALMRTALALSALTGKELTVTNIRSNRPKPGLKMQHLKSIEVLKEMCSAETSEIKLGTTRVTFKPGKIRGGKYEIDIETAGSITLLLQSLILPAMFAPSKVTFIVSGGTCGKWQASVDYLQNILLPHLQRFVEKIELKILKRGYYPKGGGQILLEISPRFKLNQLNFPELLEELEFKCSEIKLTEQGKLEQVRGIVNVSSQLEEKEVATRISKAAKNSLKEFNVPMNIREEYANSLSIGGEILLWALFSEKGKMNYDNPVLLSSDVLVEKDKSSEQIGKEAAVNLKKEISSLAAVDFHLADMLIPFMGLLPGSRIKTSKITNHTTTNIYVTEKFLDVGFKIKENIISTGKMD